MKTGRFEDTGVGRNRTLKLILRCAKWLRIVSQQAVLILAGLSILLYYRKVDYNNTSLTTDQRTNQLDGTASL